MAAVERLNDYNDGPSKHTTPPSNGSSSNFGSGGKIARVDRSFSGEADKRPPTRDASTKDKQYIEFQVKTTISLFSMSKTALSSGMST